MVVTLEFSNSSSHESSQSCILLYSETSSNGMWAFFYFIALAYCFIGLSSITARFFRSMENIVKHSRKIVEIDPSTGTELVKYEKVWNYTIADITLLAFGTSFPQISLATIDAIQNIGQLTAGGMVFSDTFFKSHSFFFINSLLTLDCVIHTSIFCVDIITFRNSFVVNPSYLVSSLTLLVAKLSPKAVNFMILLLSHISEKLKG